MFFVLHQWCSNKITKESNTIDFAYAVHTKIGNSAIGCTVNGSHATLQTILKEWRSSKY
jgi:(p)ppGpp synthase/HD superfamily hydrolase